jgi:hypothetical protein
MLLSYNYFMLGNPLTSEYVIKGDTSFGTPILQGLAGNLFSPARSFLFVSPPLVLGLYGTAVYLLKKKKNDFETLISFLSISFLGTLLLYSTWWCWYGADSFGYRFLTEWVPIVGILAYIVSSSFSKKIKILVVILMCYSILIQLNAVLYRRSRCEDNNQIWSFYCLKPLFFTKQDY